MKVLFVGAEIWSEKNPEGIVSRKLLSGFLKNNIEVTVVTVKDFSSEFKVDKIIINSDENELLGKLKKRFTGVEKKSFVQNVISAINNNEIALSSYDIIFTRSEPFFVHYIGLYAKKRKPKLKWIASFGDPVFCNPYNSGLIKKFFIKSFEKKIWENADLITHTNQSALNEYRKTGFDVEKNSFILPNPFSLSVNDSLNSNENIDESVKTKTIIRMGYIGSLYGKRKIDPFFKFIKEKGIIAHIDLIGAVRNVYYESRFGVISKFLFNKDMNKIKKKVSKYGLEDNVTFHPFMTSEMLDIYIRENIDFLINIDASIQGENIFLSSKIVDYLKYNKPILNISTRGATVDFMKSVGVEYYVDIYSGNSKLPSFKDLTPKPHLISQYEEKFVIGKLLVRLYGHNWAANL